MGCVCPPLQGCFGLLPHLPCDTHALSFPFMLQGPLRAGMGDDVKPCDSSLALGNCCRGSRSEAGWKNPSVLFDFQTPRSLGLASKMKLSFPSQPKVSECLTLGSIRGQILFAVMLFSGHRDAQWLPQRAELGAAPGWGSTHCCWLFCLRVSFSPHLQGGVTLLWL